MNCNGGGSAHFIYALRLMETELGIKLEYIDTFDFTTRTGLLRYKYCFFFLCAPSHKTNVFGILENLYGDVIHSIVDTGLTMCCQPTQLIDLLSQFLFFEKEYCYDLVQVNFARMPHCRQVFNFFKKNAQYKTFTFLIDCLNLTFMVSVNAMLEQTTSPLHVPTKLKLLKHLECTVGRDACLTASEAFDLGKYYHSNGLFVSSGGSLTLVSSDTSELMAALPTIVVDIETSAGNMYDFPKGTNRREPIVSLTLFCRHFNNMLIVVLYLRFFDETDNEEQSSSGSGGSSGYWSRMDATLTRETKAYYSKKYEGMNVQAAVTSFKRERDLLADFYKWYCKGSLLQILCNDANATHLFCGHNIIQYDCPVILARFKFHQMHAEIDHKMTFDRKVNTDTPIVKFHPRAIVVDTLQIFSSHQLSYQLSLKQLTRTYAAKQAAKFDVNSVFIRIYYIINDNLHLFRNDRERRRRVVDFLLRENEKRCQFTSGDDDAPPVRMIEIDERLPDDLAKLLSYHRRVNTVANIIQYNIIDCECVQVILDKFAYASLFTELCQLYRMDSIEESLHAKVSRRTHQLFVNEAFNQGKAYVLGAGIAYNRTKTHHCTSITTRYRNIVCDPVDMRQGGGSNAIELEQNLMYNVEMPVCMEPIVYTHTKKKYPGAVVFSNAGFYENTYQYDVISMYPTNILNDLDRDTVDVCTLKNLQHFLLHDEYFKGVLEKCLANKLLRIYYGEDYSLDYFKIVTNFTTDSANFQCCGQILSIDDIVEANGQTDKPIILKYYKSRSFIKGYLKTRLSARKRVKHLLATTREPIQRLVLDAKQKSIKVSVNSLYGIMGNINIPVASLTTLLGRKYLTFICKILYYVVLRTAYDIYRHLDAIKKNADSTMAQEAAAINWVVDVGDDYDDGRRQLSITKDTVDELLHYENELRPLLTENWLKALFYRSCMDGTSDYEQLNVYRRKMADCLDIMEDGGDGQVLNRWFARLPERIQGMVFDGDTDGLQIENVFHLDGEYLNENINRHVRTVCDARHTEFEFKSFAGTLCMKKKKYTHYKIMPHVKEEKELSAVNAKRDCKIQHSGYEQNALPPFKHVCHYVAAVCYYIRRGFLAKVTFKCIIVSIFHYLDSLPPGELHFSIDCKPTKNETLRSKFAKRYSDGLAGGKLDTVYVYERASNAETLLLLNEYIENPAKYQLNYGYFLRGFAKIWYTQLKIAKRQPCDDSLNVVNLINSYFVAWMKRDKRPFDDLPMLDIESNVLKFV